MEHKFGIKQPAGAYNTITQRNSLCLSTPPPIGCIQNLGPTLWPTQNFAVFTKIARSGKFSQNLVKRSMEPAEDCRHHETGYCATMNVMPFDNGCNGQKNKITSTRPWGTTIHGIKKKNVKK